MCIRARAPVCHPHPRPLVPHPYNSFPLAMPVVPLCQNDFFLLREVLLPWIPLCCRRHRRHLASLSASECTECNESPVELAAPMYSPTGCSRPLLVPPWHCSSATTVRESVQASPSTRKRTATVNWTTAKTTKTEKVGKDNIPASGRGNVSLCVGTLGTVVLLLRGVALLRAEVSFSMLRLNDVNTNRVDAVITTIAAAAGKRKGKRNERKRNERKRKP